MNQQRSYKIEKFASNVEGEVHRLKSQVDLFWDKEIRCYKLFGLKDGMAVLECGSGPGDVIENLLKEYPNCKATAIEIDSYLIDILREKSGGNGHAGYGVSQQSITDLGFKENSFDFVITRLVLEHLPDPAGAVKEVHRVLKPGGKAVFIDNDFEMHLKTHPEIPELKDLYDAYCRSRVAEGGNPRIGRRLPVILKQCGFVNVDLEVVCAHSGITGDDMFLKSEGVGIPSQLVKDGYLPPEILDHLAIKWYKVLHHEHHSIFRQLFIAGGEKRAGSRMERTVAEHSKVSSEKLPSRKFDVETFFSASPSDRQLLLSDYLCEQAAVALSISKDMIDRKILVSELGFDSLMAVEVINRTESDLGITLSLMDFFEGRSLDDIAQIMNGRLLENRSKEAAEVKTERSDKLTQRQGEKPLQYPLSYNQQSLWFLYQVAPEASCYNVALTCRIVSEIRNDAMLAACRTLVLRHETLRTTYGYNLKDDGDERLCQMVHSDMAFALRHIDASGLTEKELKLKVRDSYSEPFDLENGPVFRFCLFQRGKNEHVFMIAIHHIACDGWSLNILLNDFCKLYREAITGEEAGLPEVEWRYADFVGWQSKMLQGKEGERLRDFWREELSGSLPVMDLPVDYERPAVQRFNGASCHFQFGEFSYREIMNFARAENVTPYVFLLAVFQVVLMRRSNQEEMVVGTPATGRSCSEYEGICGHFVNMVAMHGNLSGDISFREHLQRTRRVVLRALDHQAYPFPLLVESLMPDRDLSRAPVFQVMFNMLNRKTLGLAADFLMGASYETPVDFGGLKILPFHIDQEEGQFDLTLEIIDTEQTLACVLKYCTDLFKEETVKGIGDDFQNFLQILMNNPEKHLSELLMAKELYSWEPAFKEQIDYWKGRLGGSLPVLQLPTDYLRPVKPEYRGGIQFFRLSPESAGALKIMAKNENTTLFVVMLAAYVVLLSKYSGQKEIMVGTPHAKRDKVEIEPFTDMLPIRVDLTDTGTFDELIHLVHKINLEALANRDVRFEQLVEILQLESSSDYHPLFQVIFAFRNLPIPKTDSSERLLHPMVRGGGVDLSFSMWEEKNALHGAFVYSAELFQANTIERMAGHFQTLIEELVADFEKPLHEMTLLTPSEKEKLIYEWNDTGTDYPTDLCLHQLFEMQVEKTPDAVAVVFENAALTYQELEQRSNKLAHHLRKLGVGPEKLVGIFMERSVEMIVAIYGIIKAGGAYVPLDPDYPAERVAYMVEDTKVPVLLTQSHLKADLPENPAVMICLDTEWGAVAQESEEKPVCQVSADNLAYVIYTSGSTGKPKGVMNSHRGICNRLHWMQDEYRLTSSDCVLQKTPCSFDVSVWEFFWPLLVGARLIVAPPGSHKDPHALVRLINEQKVTTLHFVPSMMQLFLREKHVESCTSIKRVICSGEALSRELQERFFERLPAELHNLYGPTEAAVDVTFWECRKGSKRLTVPIGKPVANTRIYILDKYMQPLPVGVSGELHIGGVQVARGYLNRPELTEEKFIPDPFSDEPGACLYKTGDLARYLPDGNIEYLGRNDFQVKVRGVRIELGEIESVICQHADVLETVVAARDDASGNKRIAAYFVTGGHVKIASGVLRGFLKEKLPDYMIPSVFIQMETLPLLENGKVNRRALPEPKMERPDTGKLYVSPRTDAEKSVAEVWRNLLGIDRVGIDDNFFEVGGDSLLLIKLANRLSNQLDIHLKVYNLIEYPTIRSVADFLNSKSDRKLFLTDMDARVRKRKEKLSKRERIKGVGNNRIHKIERRQP